MVSLISFLLWIDDLFVNRINIRIIIPKATTTVDVWIITNLNKKMVIIFVCFAS